MLIRDCMKKTVYSVPMTATVREAIALLVSRRIGLLPVLDDDRRPVGVIGLRDLLHFALPAAFQFLSDIDFVGDFGALERYRPDEKLLATAISAIMRPATVVREESGLIRSYAFMVQHDLHDLPVVDAAGRLTGIASRVDIGSMVLANWL